MKKIIISILSGICSLGAFAQQDAGFSMYFFNPVYINPAYAGSREVLSGSLVQRNQWVSMPGAPVSQSLSIHSAIPNSKVGLGLMVYNDKIGPMKNTGINLTYAYHMQLNATTKLSLGMSGSANNVRVNFDEINVDNPNDPAFTGNASSSWVPDASAGVYLYKTRFYAGLSANHLTQSRFGLTNAANASEAKFYRQIFLTSGVVIPISKSIDFRPSFLIKHVNAAPIMGEIDASFIFFQKLFIGAGLRSGKRINMDGTDNMLIGILQMQITRNLTLGYSYDYFMNQNGTYNSGTHEFMLGWDLFGAKTKMPSPRFF
ncbi:MAG: type IX secretion system membrane protein PorP/SprF [bacterium]|nr:type IX secretion system membrane protein PorP/SprF [bacterium]